MTKRDKLKRAIKRLESHYKESPCGNLLFAVIARAIDDLCLPDDTSDYRTAERFLFENDRIAMADNIGLDTDYVRRVIRECVVTDKREGVRL